MIPCPFNSLLKSLVFGGKERQQNRSLLFFLFLSFSSAMIPQDDMSYKFPSSFYLLITSEVHLAVIIHVYDVSCLF